jgi:phenylacetate-CoA ligase
MSRYFDEEMESMPKRRLLSLQLERLKSLVSRAYSSSRFYRALYDEGGVTPDDIKCIDDIQNLPFLDEQALRDAYPNGLALAPRRQFREVAGCLNGGAPALVFLTRKDLRYRAQLCARNLVAAGLREGDAVLNLMPSGMGFQGHGYDAGAYAAGMMVVPRPACTLEEQVKLLPDIGMAGVCGSPVALQNLTQMLLEQLGPRDRALRLRLAMACDGEWPDGLYDETREELENRLGVPVVDAVAMTRPLLHGLGVECEEKNGLHVWADAFLVECVHPDTKEWVEEGYVGELVWTWLAADGSAVIRYRSGDLATLTWEETCPCGRTHPKISHILGRASESFTVAGKLVLAVALEKELNRIPDLTGEYRVLIERPRTIDRVTLFVEVRDSLALQDKERTRRIRMQVSDTAKAVVGIRVQVELVPPGALPRVNTRAERIEDGRRILRLP